MPHQRLRFEPLEGRLLLASDGWDGPGLGDAALSYYIGDVPNGIDETEFRETIAAAFAAWTDVVEIEIQETSVARQRDAIDITFGEIDGAGNILAQAYFPDDVTRGRIAGDILFDIEESWEIGNDLGRRATDLMLVAVHEIGHSLGLEHSDDPNAVMYAFVSPNSMFTELAPSDRDAILALYAPRAITLQGDFDRSGSLTADDIDLLFQQIRAGEYNSLFDLNNDDVVNRADSDVMIQGLFGTLNGDANLDGVVNAQDLNQLALNWQSDGIVGWGDGDFNGDGLVNVADLNLIGVKWLVDANQSASVVASRQDVTANDENLLAVIENMSPEGNVSREFTFSKEEIFSPRHIRNGQTELGFPHLNTRDSSVSWAVNTRGDDRKGELGPSPRRWPRC